MFLADDAFLSTPGKILQTKEPFIGKRKPLERDSSIIRLCPSIKVSLLIGDPQTTH
jgi:hypothetical protein